jgi:hypothetical protein
LLRSAAGVLLAAGAFVLFARKSNHGWGAFALLVVLAAPAAVLYAFALRDPGEPDGRTAAPAQSVLAVSAVPLTLIALVQFLHWVGASTSSELNLAGAFAVTGLLAAYAAARARVSYTALLAALALLVAWFLVWDKILGHPSAGTFRWLTLAAAAVLMLAALVLSLVDFRGSNELAIVGGLAAIGAGVFGVVVGAVAGLVQTVTGAVTPSGSSATGVNSITPAGGSISGLGVTHNVFHTGGGGQHLGWDIYLLVISLALVAFGARARARGLGYVGAVGVLVFIISVSVQITRLESGHSPSHDVFAWPLVLLGLGAAGLIVSALPAAGRGGRRDRAGP